MRLLSETDELLSTALDHLRSALELLDLASAPGHIGARLDQAISDVYETIAERTVDDRLVQGHRHGAFQ